MGNRETSNFVLPPVAHDLDGWLAHRLTMNFNGSVSQQASLSLVVSSVISHVYNCARGKTNTEEQELQ